MKQVYYNILRNTLVSIKKFNKNNIFHNYDFTQSVIRYHSHQYRNRLIKKNKIFYNFNYYYYVKYLFSFKYFIKLLIFYIFPKKIDGIIYTNTEYKLKICKKIFSSSNLNLAYIKKNFHYSIFDDLYYICYLFFFIKSQFKYNFLINRLIVFRSIINFYKPKFIFSIEGDSVDESIIAQICKKKKIPHFCLQHGFNEPFILNKNSKYKFKNYFCDYTYLSKSRTHAIYLKKKNLVKNYIVVNNKEPKFINFKKKIDILITLNAVGDKGGNSILSNNLPLKFAKICSENFLNSKIIIRCHPSMNSYEFIYNYFKKNNLKISKNIIIQNPNLSSDLRSDIKTCKIGFFYGGSSLLLDAINNLVIPIVCTNEGIYDLSYLKEKKVILTFSKFNLGYNIISNLMNNDILKDKILKNINIFNRTHFYNKSNDNDILKVIKNYRYPKF
jgi:hypothetical protein